MEADDQAIQTILMGLLEDIYAAVDSCETTQEIWFTSTDGESIESYYHRFSKLMNDFNRNKHFSEKIASNLKFLNSLQPEWSRHVTIVHQTKDLHEVEYTQLYDFLKYNQVEVNKLRAERIARTHDPLALMANSNNPYNYPVFHQDQPSQVTYMQQPLPNNNFIPQPSFNTNYMQQPMPNSEDIIDPTTAINKALVLMAKAFKLNYSLPTNNNQIISSNSRIRQLHSRVVQNAVQNPGVQNVVNQNGLIVVPGIVKQNVNQNGNGNVVAEWAEGNDNGNGNNGNHVRCYNCRGIDHYARNCTVKKRDAAYLQNQLLIAQKEEAEIQLQAKEFDLMAAAGDLDEIEEVNANCILMANLRQESTPGTHTDKALVYDSDGSTEEIANLNNQLSKEKSTVSFLQEEKKRLKSDFKIHKDELLDKQIQLENNIKELDNILVKTGQSIQTIHMISPKPDSFYHTEHKMALEAAKFVRDFKSLAKEADESLAKHKALKYEIERLLKAVVSQDIMSIVQSNSIVDTSNL
ncbi:retrovirus-related pol polyprotein from transposon TNT 1-94 [Tanacetum coccineum]